MVMDDGVDSNFGGDSEKVITSVEGINLGVDKVVVVMVGVYKRDSCSRAGAGQQAQRRLLVSRHGRHGTGGRWFRNPFNLVARSKSDINVLCSCFHYQTPILFTPAPSFTTDGVG